MRTHRPPGQRRGIDNRDCGDCGGGKVAGWPSPLRAGLAGLLEGARQLAGVGAGSAAVWCPPALIRAGLGAC